VSNGLDLQVLAGARRALVSGIRGFKLRLKYGTL